MPPGLLPGNRVRPGRSFEIIGVECIGQLVCKNNAKSEGKPCVLFIACSITIGLYNDMVTELTSEEFMAECNEFKEKEPSQEL